MNKLSVIVVLMAFCLFSKPALAGYDTNLNAFDYSKADSIALHLPKIKYKTYTEVASMLTTNLHTDYEKFRAIYRWIAENIKYSYNRTDDAGKVFKAKRAVCIGYATLLKEMCETANLNCQVIEGWSKIDQSEIGQKMKVPSHAWNAINLDGKWYLTDVTWATSFYNLTTKKFVKYFDTGYFLPTPQTFIKQHFPKDKKWQLLDTIAGKKWFKTTYVWYKNMDKFGINIVSNTKGRLSLNNKKDFEIIVKMKKKITSLDSLGEFDFMIDNNPNQPGLSFKTSITDKGLVDIKCKFPESIKGEHPVTVFYTGKQIAGYMVKFY